jgi:hypothetical protein
MSREATRGWSDDKGIVKGRAGAGATGQYGRMWQGRAAARPGGAAGPPHLWWHFQVAPGQAGRSVRCHPERRAPSRRRAVMATRGARRGGARRSDTALGCLAAVRRCALCWYWHGFCPGPDSQGDEKQRASSGIPAWAGPSNGLTAAAGQFARPARQVRAGIFRGLGTGSSCILQKFGLQDANDSFNLDRLIEPNAEYQ